MSIRCVSWICDEEWMKVYHEVFSENPEHWQHALDVIAVWRKRFSSRVPVAIEATYWIMEALLNVYKLDKEAQRLSMASAIAQFVCLVMERGYEFNSSKIPMHVIGEELGIEKWVVDIRHQMSHGPLPSLCMLKKGVYYALDWLKDNHWDEQVKKMAQTELPQMELDIGNDSWYDFDDELSTMLQKYAQTCCNELYKLESECLVKKFASLFEKSKLYVQRFCVIFVSQGYYLNLDSQINENIENDFNLSEKDVLFWQPLINLVKVHLHLSNLLCSFVFRLCHCTNLVDCNVITSWCLYVIQVLTQINGNKYLFDHNTWNHIMKLLVCNVNSFTNAIYERLSPALCCWIGIKNYRKLNKLHCLFGPVLEEKHKQKELKKSDNVLTLSDLLKNKEIKPMSVPQTDEAWDLYNGKSLSKCSIGLMPGQKVKHLTLQMFDFPNISSLQSCESKSGNEDTHEHFEEEFDTVIKQNDAEDSIDFSDCTTLHEFSHSGEDSAMISVSASALFDKFSSYEFCKDMDTF